MNRNQEFAVRRSPVQHKRKAMKCGSMQRKENLYKW